jgi:hypothetical protein
MAPFIGGEADPTLPGERSESWKLSTNRLRGRLRYTPNEAGNILMEMVNGILTLRLVCDAEY